MATAHPEGEVFFLRDALKLGPWNADDSMHFYSHFLIEWVSNEAFAAQHGSLPPDQRHIRAQYIRQRATGVPARQWRYGFWSHLPVMLGHHNNIRRHFSIPLQNVVNRYSDRNRGGAQIVWLHPCPMPTPEETWAWLDLLAPIRAIYLPLSQQADEQFPQMCTYVQINFYHQRGRDVWRPATTHFRFHEFTSELGVGFSRINALGINIRECIKLLGLPPKLRITTIWAEKLIVMHDSALITTHPTATVRDRTYFDFIDFLNANFAVEVIWKPVPPRNSFILNLIQTVVSSALGLVPGVGPLLSAGFSAAWLAVTDPEGFRDWALSGGWALDLIGVTIESSGSIRRYIDPSFSGSYNVNPRKKPLPIEGESERVSPPVEAHSGSRIVSAIEPPNIENVGPSPILLDGLRIIAYSATRPKSRDDDNLHSEILRRFVQCHVMSLAEALSIQEGLEASPEAPDNDDGEESHDGEGETGEVREERENEEE